MNKEPTRTIYSCLTSAFWTQRKCFNCQKQFTLTDLTNQNYQLFFEKVLTVEQYCLEVVVQLKHQQCFLGCDFGYQSQIVCNQMQKK